MRKVGDEALRGALPSPPRPFVFRFSPLTPFFAAPYENLVKQIEIKRKVNALNFVDIGVILCGILTVAEFNRGDLKNLHIKPLLKFLEVRACEERSDELRRRIHVTSRRF